MISRPGGISDLQSTRRQEPWVPRPPETDVHNADFEMYDRVYGELFNVHHLLLPGVQLEIKFPKSNNEFYVLSNKADRGRLHISRIHVACEKC